MSRPIAVLRPEPGNRVTAIAIEAAGRRAIRLPLFETRPVAWEVPDAADHDALIVTSANAMRHGGAGLVRLLELPVHTVGQVTAEAAQRAGFRVARIGTAGAAALVAQAEAAGVRRALHLAGRHRSIDPGGIVTDLRTVYASEALPIAPGAAGRLCGAVALLHSARAARRLAEIVDANGLDRGGIALVAISAQAAEAAGAGWQRIEAAGDPAGLIETALTLAD
jgi:uroporphyrinogen-III synthase